jgi:hypothetical protein
MIIAMYLAYFGDHSMLPDDSEYVSMANWTAYPCTSPCTLLSLEYIVSRSLPRSFGHFDFFFFLLQSRQHGSLTEAP